MIESSYVEKFFFSSDHQPVNSVDVTTGWGFSLAGCLFTTLSIAFIQVACAVLGYRHSWILFASQQIMTLFATVQYLSTGSLDWMYAEYGWFMPAKIYSVWATFSIVHCLLFAPEVVRLCRGVNGCTEERVQTFRQWLAIFASAGLFINCLEATMKDLQESKTTPFRLLNFVSGLIVCWGVPSPGSTAVSCISREESDEINVMEGSITAYPQEKAPEVINKGKKTIKTRLLTQDFTEAWVSAYTAWNLAFDYTLCDTPSGLTSSVAGTQAD